MSQTCLTHRSCWGGQHSQLRAAGQPLSNFWVQFQTRAPENAPLYNYLGMTVCSHLLEVITPDGLDVWPHLLCWQITSLHFKIVPFLWWPVGNPTTFKHLIVWFTSWLLFIAQISFLCSFILYFLKGYQKIPLWHKRDIIVCTNWKQSWLCTVKPCLHRGKQSKRKGSQRKCCFHYFEFHRIGHGNNADICKIS